MRENCATYPDRLESHPARSAIRRPRSAVCIPCRLESPLPGDHGLSSIVHRPFCCPRSAVSIRECTLSILRKVA